MASRSFSKALRPLARQLASPAVQQRTFIAAAGAVRASAVAARAAVAAPQQQQVRGVKTMDFAGHKEEVYGELRWNCCNGCIGLWELVADGVSVQNVPTGPKRSSW
jgi:ketol-acid reductoisomerase